MSPSLPCFLNTAANLIYHPFPKINCACLPNLPVLNPNNYSKYLKWHEYYTRVYNEPVTKEVDLNRFTWFYWHSPLGNIDVCSVNSIYIYRTKFKDNLPWIGIYGPEKTLGKYGFFVTRPLQTIFQSYRRLEVLRVKNSVGLEHGCCWFYHTVGSGVFLKKPKNVMILKDRNNWPILNAMCLFNEMSKSAHKFLLKKNIACLIFTHAFRCYNGIPRTEIIILGSDFKKTADKIPISFTIGLNNIRNGFPCHTDILKLRTSKIHKDKQA
jgi:hypothetical protein